MTIARMLDHEKPRVEIFKGGIAIWAGDADDQTGLVISAGAAIESALAMLRLAAELGDGTISLPMKALSVEEVWPIDEDHAARLVVETSAGPLNWHLTAQELAELAAGISAASRSVG